MRVLLIATLCLALFPGALRAQGVKVITGATLIDGTGAAPVPDAVVVIDGSRIVQAGPAATVKAPAAAEVIDGRGKFVMPGLADMHNHLANGSLGFKQDYVRNLERVLAAGITTVFNPSVAANDFKQLKASSAGDATLSARFFGTGPGITVEGDQLGEGGPTPKSAAEAAMVVRELKALGVDAIKIMRDDLGWSATRTIAPMPIEVMQAVIDEAHRQQLKVFVHAPQHERAKEALRAGADGLMHGIIDQSIDPEFIALMKKNAAVYVPTMAMFEDVGDVAAWAKRQAPYWDQLGFQPKALYTSFIAPEGVQLFQRLLDKYAVVRTQLSLQRANMKAAFDAGIPVVMGSDTGFFGVLLGAATQVEMELMVEGGLKPADVIRSATIEAARMIGRDKELGSIEAGKQADLLILDANPLDDIRNVRRIYRVVKGGVVYDPARLPR